MKAHNGYVKLHRKLLEWEWYHDHAIKETWLHLILISGFNRREWNGITLKPGQCVVGTEQLAKELGFTRSQIRRALDSLKRTGEITTESTNKYTVVTIVKWEDYQIFKDFETRKNGSKNENKTPTNNQQTTNKPPTTGVSSYIIKNDKNGKKEKNNTRAREDVLSDKPPCGGKKTHTLATGEVLTDAEYKARIAALRR